MPVASLADALQGSASQSLTPQPCKVGRALLDLSPDEQGLLRDALAGEMSALALSQRLRRAGLRVGDTTIKNHRRKECACYG